jgi:hypothetical protein
LVYYRCRPRHGRRLRDGGPRRRRCSRCHRPQPRTPWPALGEADDLLVVKLDVTSRAEAEAAVRAAVERFGRIDVLVNNAANFYAGYFEELTPEQMERQLATSLIGPMNVTRAVLPIMRKQRSGTSSRSRRARASWASSSIPPTAPPSSALRGGRGRCSPRSPRSASTPPSSTLGFRTELLTQESTTYAEPFIADYAERHAVRRAWYEAQNGQQSGDPAKLAQALIMIAGQEPAPPPLHRRR